MVINHFNPNINLNFMKISIFMTAAPKNKQSLNFQYKYTRYSTFQSA